MGLSGRPGQARMQSLLWKRAGRLPGVAHDLRDGDAVRGVRSEEPLQKVLAGIAGAPGGLVLTGHDAREELLQPLQIVAAVVATLGKRQHRCA